jgi:hypothetical protein
MSEVRSLAFKSPLTEKARLELSETVLDPVRPLKRPMSKVCVMPRTQSDGIDFQPPRSRIATRDQMCALQCPGMVTFGLTLAVPHSNELAEQAIGLLPGVGLAKIRHGNTTLATLHCAGIHATTS